MNLVIVILLLALLFLILGDPLLILLTDYVFPPKEEGMGSGGRLIRLAKKGDARALRKLLDKDTSRIYLDKRDSGGMTALMHAARNGHTEIVQILIDEGIDVNRRNGGMTALTLARERGHSDIVDLLKKVGALDDSSSNKPV